MSAYCIIAHRGASGYVPEHTLASKVMAYAMGADYLEQDIVLTRDDHPLVFHDLTLDSMTNVARVFPGRNRPDGRFYVIDFTLEEIQQLRVFERRDRETGQPLYPGRFPSTSAVRFSIPTLDEELALIQGLEKSFGRPVGIYPELKSPWFHTNEGKSIGPIVLETLHRYGYTEHHDRCYVQCFDPHYLRSLRAETRLKLIQLIGDNTWNETPGVDYTAMCQPEGLDAIAEYADGVGPWMNIIVRDHGPDQPPEVTNFVQLASERSLLVHPYTFRADALPSYAHSLEYLFELFFCIVGVDGVFTDFPDKGRAFLDHLHDQDNPERNP